jgi:hypothetical protein
MGMYTALHFTAALKRDVPDDVVNILRYMLDRGGEWSEPPTPDHPLFETARWDFMLNADSYYFEADTHSALVPYPTSGFGLSITCNFKNYTGELASFLDWILPFVDARPGEFLGYHQYEEDEHPTLIYYPTKEVADVRR